MLSEIINKSISEETLFNLNRKIQKKYDHFYVINRQKTPILLIFNATYTDLTKKFTDFFNACVYVNNIYKDEIINVNINWSDLESKLLSLECDLLKIKFKDFEESIYVASTYLIHIVEKANELETEINRYLLGNKNSKKIQIKYKKLYSECAELNSILEEYFIDIENKEYDYFYKNNRITKNLFNSLKEKNLLLGKYYKYEKYDKIFKILNKT